MVIENFAWQFPFDEATVYVESDEKTCYAYIGDEDNGIFNFYGDAWLFNCGEAPTLPPWSSGEKPPFANSREFSRPFDLGDDIVPNDFSVETRDESERKIYIILFRNQPIGALWEGSTPGYSRFAVNDSPVASIMPNSLMKR